MNQGTQAATATCSTDTWIVVAFGFADDPVSVLKAATSLACLALASFLLVGCANEPAQTSSASAASSARTGRPEYEKRFDPWRASGFALEAAARGDRDAQDVLFLANYVRLSQPYAGGEDLESMTASCRELLSALGDDGFAAALRRHRPEVRSAARDFLDMEVVRSRYPQTARLLDAAPEIDWPTDQAYRRS